MQKHHIIILSIVIMLIASITPFSIHCYRQSKCKDIIQKTNIELLSVNHDLKNGYTTIQDITSILIEGEKEKLFRDLNSYADALVPITNDLQEIGKLTNAQEIRAKLEPGFVDNYIPPIIHLQTIHTKIKGVIDYCHERKQLRDRAFKNEMTLKALLKKPLNGVELPSELLIMPSDCLSLIPRKTNELDQKLSSLQNINLFNYLGQLLINAEGIVDSIHSVAKNDKVKLKATTMWNNAKEVFINVKTFNDKIHWYVPETDDGKYDTKAYQELLSQQKLALDAFQQGQQYLLELLVYKNLVYKQYVVYVSDTTYSYTSFSHSKTHLVPVSHTDMEGNVSTTLESETEWYHTDGREFFYTITTLTPNGSTNEKIKVGEKDSHNYLLGGWKTWDYKPHETKGYLIEYKQFGVDETGIIRGGSYNPSLHCFTNK
jgi:hypothetical protein